MLLTIQSFQKVVANTLENYEASMESISSKFADDMKVHIASFDKVKQDFDSIVDALKNQYQLLLNNVSQEVAKINSDIKEYGVKLNTNIENKFESVSTLLNLNSSKLDDISNKITCEIESVTDAIKNVDASQQKYLTSKFSGIDSKADLGLNEFRMDLVEYVKQNGELDGIPFGLHSVVHENKSLGIEKGVIYVLKNIK